MTTHDQELVQSQLAYYRARAEEYDDTFVPYMQPALPAALERLRGGGVRGDVLEIASGTGYWTRYLAEQADTLTALDGSAEMIEVARRRGLPGVTFVQTDLFQWTPDRRWDAIFFAHWLAHVPDGRFEAFWSRLRDAVVPGGVVEFVDVTSHERRIETPDAQEPEVAVLRSLADGSTFRIVKVFREVEALSRRISALGWSCDIAEVYPGFLYANCRPLG